MAEQIPSSSQINVDHVRHFLADQDVTQNTLDLDLQFSDEAILNAMNFAAMSYNETPPYAHTVNSNCLPFGMLFLYGTAYHLYLSKVQELQRNDIDFTGGNLTVDINKRRIEHMLKMMTVFKSEFDKMIVQRKQSINYQLHYRAY